MTMSFQAPPVDVSERAASLARRLLGGGGAASLDAYRLGRSLPFVAHGMTADGVLVVAIPTEALGAVGPTDIRLDVVRQTCDPTLTVVASSIHVLGSLVSVDEAEAASMTGLPERVAGLIPLAGMGLARVEVERAVLHDMHGATVIRAADLFHEAQLDEHAGHDSVVAHGQDALKDLCWAVLVGATPGEVVDPGAPRGVCPSIAGVHCVDVDRFGVTLLVAGAEGVQVVFAAFGDSMGEGGVEALFERVALVTR